MVDEYECVFCADVYARRRHHMAACRLKNTLQCTVCTEHPFQAICVSLVIKSKKLNKWKGFTLESKPPFLVESFIYQTILLLKTPAAFRFKFHLKVFRLKHPNPQSDSSNDPVNKFDLPNSSNTFLCKHFDHPHLRILKQLFTACML